MRSAHPPRRLTPISCITFLDSLNTKMPRGKKNTKKRSATIARVPPPLGPGGQRSLSKLLKDISGIAGALDFVPGAGLVKKATQIGGAVAGALNMNRAARPGVVNNEAPRKILQQSSMPVTVGGQSPQTYQRSLTGSTPDSLRFQCCEALTAVIPTTDANGFASTTSTGTTSWLSPRNSYLFPYLNNYVTLYTKFLFRRIRVTWMTTATTASGGQVWMCYFPDPYVGPPAAMADVLGVSQKSVWSFWANGFFAIDLKAEGKDPFYIDPDGSDDRLEQQGALFMGLMANASSAYVNPGTVFVEYDVELYDRRTAGDTLIARDALRILRTVTYDDEMRRRAGILFVEEVIRSKRKKEREAALALDRKFLVLAANPPAIQTSSGGPYPTTLQGGL